ncbi:MAG: hypothetical protein CMLOHMNK_01820 [Steroidobacteraceae bacterium]|nr:hypothetical protein [Steroidobacteraceae bacterium]
MTSSIYVMLFHLAVALMIFLGMNWLGRHSSMLGYESLTMFEERDESVAFNFVFRVATPVVILAIVAAICYALNLDGFTRNLYLAVVYSILFRVLFGLLMGRRLLLPWGRVACQSLATIAAAYVAYKYVISSRERLLPDPDSIANEAWLAIVVYLYLLAGHLSSKSASHDRRSRAYVEQRKSALAKQFGGVLRGLGNERWQMLVLAVMIVEDFNRPKMARCIERILFPLGLVRTQGIMQVSTKGPISDEESIKRGSGLLKDAYRQAIGGTEWRVSWHGGMERKQQMEEQNLVHSTLVAYNPSGDYARDVQEVFERLLASSEGAAALSLHPDASVHGEGQA